MIGIKELIPTAMRAAKNLRTGECVVIKTFKKDRRVEICRTDTGYAVREDGYERNTVEGLDEKTLKRTLRELQKTEFPRSNQVWMQVVRGNETE